MRRSAAALAAFGFVIALNGCKEADYSGQVLDPALPGQGYGMSMNKTNPGRAEFCRTALGTCRLNPDIPVARTFACSCFSFAEEKIAGRAE